MPGVAEKDKLLNVSHVVPLGNIHSRASSSYEAKASDLTNRMF